METLYLAVFTRTHSSFTTDHSPYHSQLSTHHNGGAWIGKTFRKYVAFSGGDEYSCDDVGGRIDVPLVDHVFVVTNPISALSSSFGWRFQLHFPIRFWLVFWVSCNT
ncbi:hypothetical protein AVEN_150147-1 [Araneus ventricosus]|uniref:Uncharacterized protein n=1 Tax=Araneus ventricosus TaxID=182803 RepID=A0A4Y2LXV3_ARAVE|nr:hypothetical protein AVEN_150147-1 [Araneus ventricosus]